MFTQTYGPLLVCSLCVIDPPKPEQVLADPPRWKTLTVINGQMVCSFHSQFVQGGNYSAAKMAVKADQRTREQATA